MNSCNILSTVLGASDTMGNKTKSLAHSAYTLVEKTYNKQINI